MKIIPLGLLCALVIAARVTMAAPPVGTPPVQLVLELSDGSRIIGTPSVGSLKVTTQYADLEIQLARLRTIEFSGTDHAAQLSLKNGDMLNGRLAAKEIAMKTLVGDVVIPLADVRRMRVGGGALPDGLVLHYTFNKDEGERVTDASGSGNDGTLHGAVYVNEGKSGGGAMSFNGNRVAVVARDAETLRLQDFTLMAWIKRGSTEKVSNTWPQALIVGYGEAGYNMGIDNSGAFFVGKVGVNCLMSSCKINDDSFHHIAVTKNGARIVFYLDGVAYAGGDYDANPEFINGLPAQQRPIQKRRQDHNADFEFTTGLGVGARPDTFEAGFLGLMDDVEIFNRPLTDDEVKSVYESQK